MTEATLEIEYLQRALETGQLEPVDFGTEISFDALNIRRRLTAEYAWAIPTEEALEAIAAQGPIVEIGAGNGYWAWLLQQRGVDIIAFDPMPYEEGHYIEVGPVKPGKLDEGEALELEEKNRVYRRKWADVEEGGHTLVADHPDRALFICWPSNALSWAAQALAVYEGETVIYIGEWRGCTADEDFHDLLERDFVEVARVVIPRFLFINDDLTIWKRA